jgi:hypothetical protein
MLNLEWLTLAANVLFELADFTSDSGANLH